MVNRHPKLRITQDEFREWLKTTPRKTVGIAASSYSCPLATFIVEKNNFEYFTHVSVAPSYEPSTYTVTPKDVGGALIESDFYSLKKWQNKFATLVDKLSEDKHGDVLVTKEQALQILSKVTKR